MRGAESGSQLEWAWTHREWPVNIDARGSVRQRAAREPPDDHIAPPGLNYNPSTTGIYGTPTTPGTWDVTATAYLAGIPVETATSRVTITGNATAPAPGGGGGAPAPGSPAPGQGGGAPGAPTFAAGIDLAVIDTLPLPPEAKQAAKDALINFDQMMADFWASVPQS